MHKRSRSQSLKNSESGQSLVEYLILVSLMGIATLAAVRVLSQNVVTRFANVADALHGGNAPSRTMERVETSQAKKKDMSTFFHGSGSRHGD